MIELRCPACGLANGVPEVPRPDDARCADCARDLRGARQVGYAVRGEGTAWGHHVRSDLAARAARGTLTRDMWISEEGGPWYLAGERLDLFGRTRPRGARAPRAPTFAPVPTSRTRRSRPPGSVETMAVLDALAALLLVLLAVVAFILAASLGAGVGSTVVPIFLGLVSWMHVALGRGLCRRSRGARAGQLWAAGIYGLLLVFVGPHLGGLALLVGAALVALPFLLLLNRPARAWFEQADDDPDAGRSGRPGTA